MTARKWEKVGSKEIYRNGPFFWVTEDEVLQPDGKTTQYGVVHSHGAVFVVALTTSNEYVFVRQHRYPVDKETIELIAGGLGDNEPDPVEQAKHEVEEEIGTLAQEFELVGSMMSSPSRSKITIHVVLAKGIDKSKIHLDGQEGNEAINEVLVWPEAEVVARLAGGELNDMATVAALNLYWAEYGFPKNA